MSPFPAPAGPASPAPALRAALVGLGRRGGDWLAALAGPASRAAGVEPMALCEPDPDRARAALARAGLRLPVAETVEGALALAPDLVIDCTPPAARLAVARAAVLAGVHVICEAPLALDEETALALAAATRARGRLAVLHRIRPLPGARALRGLAASGRLGRAHALSAILPADDAAGFSDQPAGRAALRGPLLHALDAARLILGAEPLEVAARGAGGRLDARLLFADGTVAEVAVAPAPPGAPEAGSWRLGLAGGAARWDGRGPAVAEPDGGPPQALGGAGDDPLAPALAAAVAAIRDGRAPAGGPRDAAATLAVALAALRSIRAGGRPEPVRPLHLRGDASAAILPRPAPRPGPSSAPLREAR